jgi:hypothetical protein
VDINLPCNINQDNYLSQPYNSDATLIQRINILEQEIYELKLLNYQQRESLDYLHQLVLSIKK